MKRNYVAAVLITGASLLWACGGNDKNDGGTTTTGENTMVDSTATTPAAGAPAAGNAAVSLDTMDQNFAMKAASGGMMEVQAANLAMQNAASDRVKNFATMMIRDHGKANDELKSIASGKGVSVPTDLMPEHKEHINMLQGKTGKEFDKAYMSMMVNDHKKDVSEFEKASKNAKDADIKNFATQTLPVLRMHLDSAQAINKGKM